jgi:hypothetical protein
MMNIVRSTDNEVLLYWLSYRNALTLQLRSGRCENFTAKGERQERELSCEEKESIEMEIQQMNAVIRIFKVELGGKSIDNHLSNNQLNLLDQIEELTKSQKP